MRPEIYLELKSCLERGETAVVVTVLTGSGIGSQLLVPRDGEPIGGLGEPDLDRRAAKHARGAADRQASERLTVGEGDDTAELFFDVHPPPERLIIVGAVHVAIHLIDYARALGFRTVVIDPRTAFATPERFAAADALIPEWPEQALEGLTLDESTYFVTLSHDFKIDLPALAIALRSPARYVGALGSRRTHDKRIPELREMGLTDEQIDRIHAPIGLDLGGRRAEEIALAIAAQIVAARHGRA